MVQARVVRDSCWRGHSAFTQVSVVEFTREIQGGWRKEKEIRESAFESPGRIQNNARLLLRLREKNEQVAGEHGAAIPRLNHSEVSGVRGYVQGGWVDTTEPQTARNWAIKINTEDVAPEMAGISGE
ncbi:hypothetical protein B0H17DRAFT_1144996 [Mycena rosella]|uniref:Uncharacterized protein n=1 Tax=Mycena rosella TaxID=1033263 RepID=A0AAD7G2B4_MYCRO|nr:hypothetical protein B0H17DRAFT_1144996 [Mycena rosella]